MMRRSNGERGIVDSTELSPRRFVAESESQAAAPASGRPAWT